MRGSLSCLLAWLWVVSTGSALARPFVIDGQPVELEDISATVEVYFRSMRLNRVVEQWNFELQIRNTSVTPLTGTVVVVFESAQNTSGALAPDGRTEDGRAWFNVSTLLPDGGLPTGAMSEARTLALGVTSGAPKLSVKVYGGALPSGPALGFVRTLDGFGLPLPAAQITELGPNGSGTTASDRRFGVATVGQGSGLNTFRFEAAGYVPVWRKATLATGSVREIPSPRLTMLSTNPISVSPLGGVISNTTGSIQISIPAGVLNSVATGRLTPLTAQTLPAFLPTGWSPLQGFWWELSQPASAPLPARLELWETLAPDELGVWVRWDSAALEWRVMQTSLGLGSAVVTGSLAEAGGWAFVVGDTGPNRPPAVQVGAALPSAGEESPDWFAIAASGRVIPGSSPASPVAELVTAAGELMISNRVGALRSGTVLRGRIGERYELRDGATRITPAYENFFVGYQRPGDGQLATLQATLPLRPQLLLGADELLRGTVELDVFPPGSFGGAVFFESGGWASQEGVRVTASSGAAPRPQAVQLVTLAPTNFASLAGNDLAITAAFQLTVGDLAPEARLQLQVGGLATNSLYVLARVLATDQVYGLDPLERFSTDVTGQLVSGEPVGGPRLPGLDGAGQLVLARVSGPQALVTGIARDPGGNLARDFVVQLGAWTTRPDDEGRFRLLAPLGTSQLVLTDPRTGQRGVAPVVVANGQSTVNTDITTAIEGPRVLSVSPPSGSSHVPVIAPVEVTFSKPLHPASVVGAAIQLLGASNQPVLASVGLNLRGDVATLLPMSPLTNGVLHTLLLSTNLTDLAGARLVGSNRFSFTTAPSAAPRLAGAQLVSFEPTNGLARLQGSAGLAEPGQAVVLVNETTGRTETVLSAVDGSFSGSIPAALDDALRVTVRNANGSVNSVAVSRQVFADGSVALFSEGGTIEVAGEHGPIQFAIEPGSLNGKTKFKFESVPLAEVLTVVSNTQPEGGRILGGVKVSAMVGNPMNESMDVSFSVNVADMQLPQGVSPSNCSFGLVIARVVDDAPVFELVDRMHFEEGKLVTHSPPFFGLLGPFEDILVLPLLMFTAEVPMLVTGHVYATDVDPGTHAPLTGATKEYLSGAIVSGRGRVTAIGLRGRLRPGTVYSSSGPDGRYSLMVSAEATSASKPVAITATHPRFPNQRPESVMPELSSGERLAIGNLLSKRDIIFPKTGGSLDVPPQVDISQAPALPQPGTDVILSLLASDDSTVPFLNVELAGVTPVKLGQIPSLSDVTFLEGLNEVVGATARRREYTLRSARAQLVNLRITSMDGNGHERTLTYPVVFGAEPPPPADNPPVSDDHDQSGPYVVGMSPSPGSTGMAPGQPLILRFNEPIRREVLTAIGAVTLEPFGGSPRLQLSSDQTQLSVLFPMLRTNTEYALTLGYSVQDLARNLIDQRPGEPGSQTFTTTFRTARSSAAALDEIIGRDQGAGAVVVGNYALIAERRGSSRGRIAVLDLSLPAQPQIVNEISLPEFPRDLLFLPRSSFVYTNGLLGGDGRPLPVTLDTFTNPQHSNRVVRTNDLLVVVGGLAGQGQLQWLRVLDVSNPLRPELLVGMVIGVNGLSLPGRLRWSGPTLAYLETATPDRISLLNLQSLIIADLLSSNQPEYRKLPDDGQPGTDLNGDGDYVDAGETLPLPARDPFEFGGKELAVAVPDTDQAIIDFVIEDGGAYLGALLDQGRELGPDGRPQNDRPVPAAFRTLLANGITPPRELASFEFAASRRPRRAESWFQFPLPGTNGIALRDLVFVALRGNRQTGETNNFLSVLDFTDRLAIEELVEIPLPKDTDEGGINSIQRRDDGLLAVASDRVTYLLDPAQFRQPLRSDGSHASLVGVIDGIGGFARRFDSTQHGLHVAADVAGRAQLVQTAPLLSFVGFPGVTPFDPATLASRSMADQELLLEGTEARQFLLPGRIREPGECNTSSLLTNLDPRTHHYVLVHAPGGAGRTLEVALETLGWSGYPLRKRGFLFPPVHAVGADALEQLGQTPAPDEAPVRSLRAWRVSNQPASPYYNLYVSRPFVLVAEEASRDELAQLRAPVDREILWSGFGLRASLDLSLQENPVLGPFVGRVDLLERVLKPGVEITADSFPGDLLPSPNPGPITGEMMLPLALNSVAAHSSELVINATDLVLMGRRLPFEFRRTFRGQSLYDGPFGRGWDFSYNQRLVDVPAIGCLTLVERPDPADREVAQAGDLLFHTGGGQIVVWRFAGTNAPPEIANDPLIQQLGWIPKAARFYLPPAGLFAPIIRFKDGRSVRLEPNGTQYWFNPSGRFERMYDRYEKNFFELQYNSRGELARIENENRKAVEFGYYRIRSDPEFRAGVDEIATRLSDVGRICRLKDWSGRDVRYQYSTDGLLEKYLGPEISTGPADAFKGRPEIVYRYSGSDQPSHTSKSLIGVEGSDVGGAPVIAVADLGSVGRDTVGKLNLMGQSIVIQQPHTNTATGLAASAQPTVITSQDGFASQLKFDRLGRVSEAVLAGAASESATNRQEYFPDGPLRGLVRATVSALGDRTEFIYDPANASLRSRGNLKGLRKVPGFRGGPILEASTEYDPFYNLPSGTKRDFNNVETTIVLASDRRSVERLSRAGEREIFTVNEFGQPAGHTAMEGTVTQFDYTDDGYLSTRTVGNRMTRFLYAPISGGASDPGQRGKPSQVIGADGVPVRFLHDELDRLVEQEREGLRTVSSFDAVGNLRRRITTVEAERSAIEEFDYLSHGFLREQRLKNVETGDGLADLVTTFDRDPMGRVKSVIFPGGEVRRFFYDFQSRLQREEVPGSHTNHIAFDAVGNVTNFVRGAASERYVYDGHDRLIGMIGANGTTVEYVRDGNGNVTTNRTKAADGTLLSEVRFEFDPLNRLRRKFLRRDDGESVLSTEYNSGERSVTVTDALGAQVKTFLDEEGRAERVQGPNHTVQFDRDLNSNVTRRRMTDLGGTFSTGYGYNTRNQLVATTNSLGDVASYVLELDGRPMQLIDHAQNSTTNEFTLLGEVSALFKPNRVSQRHQFDLSRNLTAFHDAANNLTRYQHDAQNRLVTNRLPNDAETVFSAFNAFGSPTQVRMPRGLTVEARYDFEGKLTNRVVTGLGPIRQEQFEYDGLRRYRKITDPSGILAFEYDLAGFIREVSRQYQFTSTPSAAAPLNFTVRQNTDAGMFRSEIEYPVDEFKLSYSRDNSGRLQALLPATGEPIIRTNSWLGDARLGSRILGNNRIRLDLTFDGLPRITGRRYTRISDGAVLVDVRQAYDRNGAVVARQSVHRGGRADVFQYDSGYRLLRADLEARPALTGEVPNLVIPDFAMPSEVGGSWQSGSAARVASYGETDVIEAIQTLNPLGIALPPVAATFAGANTFLAVTDIDGFAREVDEIGNVTRTRLAVRIPGQAQASLVGAQLTYNDLGQLVRITRDDGVTVFNEYDQNGLRIRRAVTGPAALCVPSDIAFLYDGIRLIEERDLSAGASLLRRYFYSDDGDEVVAAEIRDSSADPFRRVYFLTDNQRSVLALADQDGAVVERRRYDAWGQPLIESPDTRSAGVSWIRREANGLLLAFSEPILPAGAASEELLTNLPALTASLQLTISGAPVSGRFVPEDSVTPAGFGSAIRFVSDQPLAGTGELRLSAGGLRDDWGNLNAAATIPLNLDQPTGTQLFTGIAVGSTAPERLGRTGVGVAVMFHGQMYDEDAGLLYCRARFYDPYTASFLQRDPAGFVDSVNPYTAFAHNPISFRDPTGASIVDDMRQMGETLQEDADKHRESGGFVNLALSMVEEGFAGLRQMPAATRDSWNLLQSESQGGTLDLLNRMKAAEVVGRAPVAVIGVVASGVGAIKTLKTASSFLAQRARGLASTLARRTRLVLGRGTAVDFLMTQGLTRWEAEGYVNTLAIIRDHYKSDQVEAAVRSFGKKANLRRENRERLMSVKPEWTKTKTADVDASVNISLKQGDGSIIHREFTGDLDFYYIKVNGRRLEEHEFQQFKHVFNREMTKAYRRQGGTGNPGASVLHGAHLNLPELQGNRVEHLGADLAKKPIYQRKGGGEAIYEMLPHSRQAHYDMDLMRTIKGPGPEAFSVRMDGLGRVQGFNPEVGQLRRELNEVAREFRWATGIELGEHGWYNGFEKHLPTAE